jgi:hypothetical protein
VFSLAKFVCPVGRKDARGIDGEDAKIGVAESSFCDLMKM